MKQSEAGWRWTVDSAVSGQVSDLYMGLESAAGLQQHSTRIILLHRTPGPQQLPAALNTALQCFDR